MFKFFRRFFAPKVIEKVIEVEKVVERVVAPSYILEDGVVDLHELLVEVITLLHEYGGVSDDPKLMKAWENFVGAFVSPEEYPVVGLRGQTPVLWVGDKIPPPILDRLSPRN